MKDEEQEEKQLEKEWQKSMKTIGERYKCECGFSINPETPLAEAENLMVDHVKKEHPEKRSINL